MLEWKLVCLHSLLLELKLSVSRLILISMSQRWLLLWGTPHHTTLPLGAKQTTPHTSLYIFFWTLQAGKLEQDAKNRTTGQLLVKAGEGIGLPPPTNSVKILGTMSSIESQMCHTTPLGKIETRQPIGWCMVSGDCVSYYYYYFIVAFQHQIKKLQFTTTMREIAPHILPTTGKTVTSRSAYVIFSISGGKPFDKVRYKLHWMIWDENSPFFKKEHII